MFGVHIEREEIYWGTVGGSESIYEQIWGDRVFRIENHGKGAAGYVDGRKVFEAPADMRLVTDLCGRLVKAVSLVKGKSGEIKVY